MIGLSIKIARNKARRILPTGCFFVFLLPELVHGPRVNTADKSARYKNAQKLEAVFYRVPKRLMHFCGFAAEGGELFEEGFFLFGEFLRD
jgi:hypothetical protein